MRWPRRRPAFALPAMAILAFVTLLSFSLLRLFQIEQDMRGNVDENMLWVTAQAQVASHRFAHAVDRQALGNEDTDPELRFDILTSRLVLMDEGPQRRYLQEEGLAALLDTTLQHLDAIETILMTPQPNASQLAATVSRELDPLTATLNRIATGVMSAEWEATGERLDTYHDSLFQVIASAIGILICGLLLIGLLIHTLRQRRLVQLSLIDARDHLEIEVARRTHELESERQRVVTAIETAPDGFAAFGPDGRLTLTNPQLSELLAVPPERLTPGQTLDELLGAIRHHIREEELTNLASGRRHDGERHYDLELPDRCWRQLTVRPTADGGQVLRVADITRYKAAASALEHSLLRERGVSEFYRSFAAMVSHQFRTPLAVIDSGLQRLQRRHQRFTPEQRVERYQRLREAVEQMTRLLGASLTAARLDGRQVESMLAGHSLPDIVDRLCRLHAEANGTERLTVEHGHPAPLAWCDRALTEQVLDNLISNALKYTSGDQPVRISTARENDWIICQVKDHGPGITVEEQDRVFERFYRGKQAAGTEGIGLGLNIAHHLAHIQHGDLTIQSSPGEGSTFTLWLPSADTREASHEQP